MRFTSYFKYTIGFILGALLLSACQEKSPVPEVLRPVRYQTIYATGGDRMRTFSGVAQAAIESRLSFKVGGTIRNINVKVGDEV
ncbi:MAG: efflux RND transporter periplasmic adaptor subunit, partial [Calditrichaeota bacterium]|nr:efflux RND transporter periplasmic adaptor subunit [Calditrichota bacterium]